MALIQYDLALTSIMTVVLEHIPVWFTNHPGHNTWSEPANVRGVDCRGGGGECQRGSEVREQVLVDPPVSSECGWVKYIAVPV